MDTEVKQLIRRLRKIEKEFPKGYWIFASEGKLNLMRERPEGRELKGAVGMARGAMDPAAIVEQFDIPSDGGEW